jgi:hypothetical protein
MSKLELLTRQALVGLSRQMDEPQAQDFLRREFDLSAREAHLLAEEAQPSRQQAVQNLTVQIQERLKTMQPAERNSFIRDLFPSLGEEERLNLVIVHDQEIPPRPPHGFGYSPTYVLILQGLESTVLTHGPDKALKYYDEKFPDLFMEVNQLVQPDAIDRHKAVGKVVQAMEEETRNRSESEVLEVIAEKLPTLDLTERSAFVSALDEEFPPKEKRKEDRDVFDG